MTFQKRVKFKDIDPSVLHQMPKTGRINLHSARQGDGHIICTVCGDPLRSKGRRGQPGKDFQNYRSKAVKDLEWDPPGDPKAWVHCAICEPCNRVYFEHDVWKGAV